MRDISVSVVIPTHDRLPMVREATQSVLAQSYADFELIVVDDGSNDGTAGALRAEFGSCLRVIETPNRGVSSARNTGAAAARGRWLAFLDSDDLWLPDKLRLQLADCEAHPRLRITQTEEVWIRKGVRVNPCRRHAKPAGDVFIPSLERCLVSPSTVIVRRELFEASGGFDEDLPVCEDYDLWLRLARVEPFGLLRNPLVIKRGGHADQLSRRFWGMDRFRVASLQKILCQPLSAERRQAALDALRRKCAILALGAEKRGRGEEAERYRALTELHA